MNKKKAKKNPSRPSRQLNVLSSGTWLQYNNFEGLQRCLFLSTSIFMFYVFCLSRVSRTNNKTRNKKNNKKKSHGNNCDENKTTIVSGDSSGQQWATGSRWSQPGRSMISWQSKGTGDPPRPTGTPRNDRLVPGGKLWHFWDTSR